MRDHGICFKYAVQVFESPLQAEWIDDWEDYGEERWNVVGLIADLEVLVTYTVRGNDVRVLSARRPTRYERKVSGEISFELDPNNPPTMSEERIAALRSMTDEDIDYSDIPSQAGPPTRRVLGPRFRTTETVVVLEQDVVSLLQESGSVSAERINAALREYAEMHRKSA